MTKVILIRGLPGSGKSTVADAIVSDMRQRIVYAGHRNPSIQVRHFEADMFFVRNARYEFDATKLRQAHEWCQQSFLRALEDKIELVVVSNTFTTRNEIEWYLDTCASFEITPQIITVQGDFGSVHDVPEETVQKMRDRFEHDLASKKNKKEIVNE